MTRTGTSYSAVVTGIGNGYSATDQLVFVGTQLGGATTANDMTLTVDSVDGNGGILTFSVAGTSVNSQSYPGLTSGTNVTGQNGTFDVAISGTSYTVTLNNAGDDYGVGQTLTIPGTSLGGATPANDVSIVVDSVAGTGASAIAVSYTHLRAHET